MFHASKRSSLKLKMAGSIGFTLRHAMMYNFYVLDAANTIVTVGDNWNSIALSNGGERAVSDAVLGRPLWEFVSGSESAGFINAVVFWCRRERKAFSTQYRFDSPEEARLYAMKVVPKDDDFVLVTHQLLGTSHRAWQSTLTPIKERVEMSRCSMCCHYKMGEDWIDPFTDLVKIYQPSGHTICPECKARATAHMDDVAEGGNVIPFRSRTQIDNIREG